MQEKGKVTQLFSLQGAMPFHGISQRCPALGLQTERSDPLVFLRITDYAATTQNQGTRGRKHQAEETTRRSPIEIARRRLSTIIDAPDDAPRMTKGPPKVFVDAKIVGRHNPEIPKRTIVAYVVEGRDDLRNATEVKADETDDAELHAIAFAIHELKNKLAEFRVICDNESVVSVIITENQKTARKRPILSQLLAEKGENSGIKVELLENNPAHKFLNMWLSKHPTP